MALASYTDLKASLALWLRRSDLTAMIPDFITMAESQMNRRIRSRHKIARADSSISGEFMALPTDFAGVRAFKVTGASPVRTLAFITPEQMADQKSGRVDTTGTPSAYTIVGDEFEFDLTPTAALACEISYYQTIPSLSASNASNWVLENYPDAYVYGALLQSAPYLKDDARMSSWGDLFGLVMDDINGQSMAESHGGAMSMTPSGGVV